jgi:ribosomal protein L28
LRSDLLQRKMEVGLEVGHDAVLAKRELRMVLITRTLCVKDLGRVLQIYITRCSRKRGRLHQSRPLD